MQLNIRFKRFKCQNTDYFFKFGILHLLLKMLKVTHNKEEIKSDNISMSDYVEDNSIVIPDKTIISHTIFSNINDIINTIEVIRIGDFCSSLKNSLLVRGFSKLTSISIGRNSFCKVTYSYCSDESSKMEVADCSSLQTITVGCYSFSSCGKLILKGKIK